MQDTITLKANSNYPVRVSGKHVTILACTAALNVEMDQGGVNHAVAGSQLSSDGFSKLTFFETSGADNVVTFYAGDMPSPGRATVVAANSSTFAQTGEWWDFGTASGLSQGKITMTGTDQEGRSRKFISITNLGYTAQGGVASTALIVGFIGGQTTLPAFAVFPGTNLTLEMGDDLILWSMNQNLSGQPTHLMGTILQVFYSKPLQTDQ